MPRQMPDFDTMWANYPHGGASQVREMIGGAVDNDLYENTCAIRMSYVMNHSGDPIPAGRRGLYTVKGGDNKWYALRSRELPLNYFAADDVFGTPQLTVYEPGESTLFDERRGIISFIGIPGYLGGFGGHVDLWNGTTSAHGHYFGSKEVRLWEAVPLSGDDLARCKTRVNIRRGPGTQHDKAGKLGVDSLVRIQERQGKWIRIGAQLWVHKNYVDEISPPPLGDEKVRITTARLNVRSGAGSRNRIVTMVHQGDVFPVYGRLREWIRIKLVPEGWVHSRYTEPVSEDEQDSPGQPSEPVPSTEPDQPDEPTPSTEPDQPDEPAPSSESDQPDEPEPTQESHPRGEITASCLNVRQGPGTGYRVLKKLRRGDEVEIYDELDGWCKVEENPDGWAFGRYVRTIASAAR